LIEKEAFQSFSKKNRVTKSLIEKEAFQSFSKKQGSQKLDRERSFSELF
jgi:hypothetical protein